jgi:diguanylate cyclase (GGDEF)-like protein
MIGDVSYDFSSELMNGINDAAQREGVQLFYMTGMQKHTDSADPNKEHETASRHNSIYDYANLVGADAYIISCGSLSGFESDQAYREFLKRFEKSACVVLQKDIDIGGPGMSCITIDNYNSYSNCLEHLIQDHGYQKIAYVSGPKEHPEARERERAYRDTMEKYGLPVLDSMIAYGDLSGFADKQVSKLLNDHPGLEAIAFCNDEMAKAGYRVCQERGLQVGKDIAVTGFDDFTTGRTLTPPLTTISQNAYQMGDLAVMQAMELAEGKSVEPVKLTTRLHIRSSCGCTPGGNAGIFDADAVDEERYVSNVIRNMQADLVRMFEQAGHERYAGMLAKLTDYIASLALAGPSETLDEQALSLWLAGFAGEIKGTGVLLAERLHHYLLQLPGQTDHPCVAKLFRILFFMQGFLYSYEMRENEKRFENFRAQSWFVPEFIRDLVVLEDEDEGVFRNAVERLQGIGLDNVYICLLPEPQIVRESGSYSIPDRVLLAAYLSNSRVIAYPRSQMPVLDANYTLRSLPDLNCDAHLISFSIFSGDVQYGILMCQANKEKMPLLHVIGLQLGILINFLDLKSKERIVGRELEHIRERIEILNFLSEYDALCNVFNRRGFIERAIRMNRDNVGKHAICVFMDLDHLKQINDNFGHSSGDDVLCVVSDILKRTVRSGDLIARIGGDEFVGMFITDNQDFDAVFRARLKEAFDEYNHTSNKPYYVEVSAGVADFTCRQGLEISKIINDADRYLYEEKKHRRESALK